MEPTTPVSMTDSEWAVITGALIASGHGNLAIRIRNQLFEQWGDE